MRKLMLVSVLLTVAGAREAACQEQQVYHGLDDMPAGALQIQAFPDGLINVKARCVPAQKLIDELAKYLDKPVTSDKPLRPYVSLWLADDKRPPRAWLSRMAGFMQCGVVDDGPSLRIAHSAITGLQDYDPFADEEQILAGVTPSPEPTPVAQGVSGGLLFLNGRMIPPPYAVERVQGEGFVSVTINGLERLHYRLDPALLWSSPSTVPRPTTVPEPGSIQTTEDLRIACAAVCGRVEERDGGWEEARQAVLEYLSRQQVFEVTDPNDPWIGVRKRDEAERAQAIPDWTRFWFDKHPTAHAERIDPATLGVAQRNMLEQELGRSGIKVCSTGGEYSFGHPDSVVKFREAFEGKYGESLLERECILAELVGDRVAARQMVVMNQGRFDEVAEQVRRIEEAEREAQARQEQKYRENARTGATDGIYEKMKKSFATEAETQRKPK